MTDDTRATPPSRRPLPMCNGDEVVMVTDMRAYLTGQPTPTRRAELLTLIERYGDARQDACWHNYSRDVDFRAAVAKANDLFAEVRAQIDAVRGLLAHAYMAKPEDRERLTEQALAAFDGLV